MKDELNERIGYEMRTQRLIRRLTLQQVADRMKVASRNTVSLWELGKTEITVSDLKRYCDVIGINYIDLLNKVSGDM